MIHNSDADNEIAKALSTVEMVNRIFPFKREEELKIYAIISARKDVASLISSSSIKLTIVPEYNLDEAMKVNDVFLKNTLPQTHENWRGSVFYTATTYQHLIPVDKIVDMVERIRGDQAPQGSKKDTEIAQLEAYARYVFDSAKATPYEKGILTGILKRFRSNITNSSSKQNGTT